MSVSPPTLMPRERISQHARRAFLADWRSDLSPRIKRSPSRWATEVRKLAAGQSPLSRGQEIAYRHEIMPHCVQPMDDADNPEVRRIVLWWGIRLGKTGGVCCNIFGRTVTDDQTNVYSVHPTDPNAALFSSGDVEPMIEACLKGCFVEKKSRDSGRTISFKKFAGGWIRIVSAGSLDSFRGTTVGVLFLHELDALDEDSIFKAIGRTTGFAHPIIVMESTCTLAPITKEDGTLEYRSKIQQEYERGDKRKRFCECRACGHLQWLKYPQIKPEKAEDFRTSRYHCEKCDAPHTDKQFQAMKAKAVWYPTAGLSAAEVSEIRIHHHKAKPIEEGVQSYWLNGFYSMLPKGDSFRTQLHQFLVEGESAKRSRKSLEIWTNEVAAEVWNPDDESSAPPEYQPIVDGREDYATEEKTLVPAEALVCTTMTDIHANRLEVEWSAWSKLEECWGLGHFVFFGDTSKCRDAKGRLDGVWREWALHLQRQWDHELGGRMAMNLGLIDGGWAADRISPVLQLLKAQHLPGVSGKLIMSKGTGRHEAVIVDPWGTIMKRHGKGIHIGTWCAKSLIYERLRWYTAEEKPKAGFIHFGKCYTEEFIRQLVSERPVMQVIRAREVETFKNPDSNRNEGIDLKVGNLAAFRRKRWDYEVLERELTVKDEPPEPPEPVSPPTRPNNPTRGGMGRGWSL